MSKDNVLALRNPGIANEVPDVLTQVLRDGAQQMLARAIEAEVVEFLERYRFDNDEAGRRRMVRNGYLPQRTTQTGWAILVSKHRGCGIGQAGPGLPL